MSFLSDRNTLHVEIRLKSSDQRLQTLRSQIEPPLLDYLKTASAPLLMQNLPVDPPSNEPALALIEGISLEQDNGVAFNGSNALNRQNFKYLFHFYMTRRAEMCSGLFDNGCDGDGVESVVAANHWLLPSNEFVGLWENLMFENGLKEKLLKFALSALSFSQHKVNTNIIACNRLILLHGPPGTGKTSLCKALAQKLAIRTQNHYVYTHLVEINSHSLFSKWFSESGKLVARLFGKIDELVADSNNLVCVLIDEVESLAYARCAMSNNEPRDAMRVVNAVLTQLDEIKTKPNVLILATSNLAQSIDLAFLDRVDIRQYVGLPAVPAIKAIYKSMVLELMTTGIIQLESLDLEDEGEGLLTSLSERSVGLSGRTLRKLPLLAHAAHTSSEVFERDGKIRLQDFLDSMLMAVEEHLHAQQHLKK